MDKQRVRLKLSVRSAVPAEEKGSYETAKRTMDVIGACVGLLLFSFFFIVIALLIKAEDPAGRIFFKQKRIGKNGKEFEMYKFRSMVSNAEEMLSQLLAQNEIDGAMFKLKQDPRITRTGRLLRKTSLDEIPQLWNVLKGDMSLVGPRPALPREVAVYTSYDRKRLSVIPGCTGIWQVSGRNSVGFKEMVEMDIEYIQKQCFWLDMKIILKTFSVFLGSKNAF